MRVLDVCTGSGQVARAAIEVVGIQGSVVGLDGSLGMVAEARQFVPIPLMQGYVERLPVAAQQFDAVTMGYALRHVADLRLVFQEYFRILKPGGRLLVLEFTKPSSKCMYHAARVYLRRVVPAVARLKGRDARTLMEYFWDTIENCVPPEVILQALGEAGFSDRSARFGQIDLFSEYTASRPSELSRPGRARERIPPSKGGEQVPAPVPRGDRGEAGGFPARVVPALAGKCGGSVVQTESHHRRRARLSTWPAPFSGLAGSCRSHAGSKTRDEAVCAVEEAREAGYGSRLEPENV